MKRCFPLLQFMIQFQCHCLKKVPIFKNCLPFQNRLLPPALSIKRLPSEINSEHSPSTHLTLIRLLVGPQFALASGKGYIYEDRLVVEEPSAVPAVAEYAPSLCKTSMKVKDCGESDKVTDMSENITSNTICRINRYNLHFFELLNALIIYIAKPPRSVGPQRDRYTDFGKVLGSIN